MESKNEGISFAHHAERYGINKKGDAVDDDDQTECL